jgi:hypothetical protein
MNDIRCGAKERRGDELDQPAPDWKRAHEELVRLANSRARLDQDEGRWLVVAAREGTHARMGYASFVEYVERLFGYSPRFTLEKLRVAEALEKLPALARALDDGLLSWSATRELTRVAVPGTEGEWLAGAAGKTARDVERLVSGHAPGSKPSEAPEPALRRHVIRLEVSGEAFAAFRDAMAKVRRDAGSRLDDDQTVLLFARYVLGGPTDEGRASYQIALSVCEDCRRAFQRGRGELVEIEPSVVETAGCDSQNVPSDPHVEESTHVGATSTDKPRSGARQLDSTVSRRTKQSIPPSIRRTVLRRDSGRCSVPGCRHAVFVDVHHLDPKADGGGHDIQNLLTLCAAHHRAVHRGTLSVCREGGELRFQHADGSEYGAREASPAIADVRAKVFQALRGLGFREAESTRALNRTISDMPLEATTETLLRRALRELDRSRAA